MLPWGLFVVLLLAVLASVIFLVRHLADDAVPLHVKLSVGFSWAVALMVVALIPLDVVVTLSNDVSGKETLLGLYQFPYWSTQLLTWLLLPLHQLYADAGDFTPRARLKTSLKENLLFYAVLGGVGLVAGVIILATKGKQGSSGFASGAVACSLSFSIATGILLMGYGFSEIPRTCWMRSSTTARKLWCEYKVGQLSEKLGSAHGELSKVVWSVEQMSITMPRRHRLRWAMEVIEESVKRSAVAGAAPESEDKEPNDDYDYEDLHALAALRRRLNRAIGAFDRTKHQFKQSLADAIEVDDVVLSIAASVAGGDRVFRSTLRPQRVGRHAVTKDKVEYWWKCVARPYVMRALAVLLAFTSFIIVLAEITMWLQLLQKNGQNVSVISMIIASFRDSTSPTVVLSGLVLFYMLACAYFTLLKLAMFSFFHVVPHHTDGTSMLMSATLFCRFSAPMCYNFVSFIPALESHDKFGNRTSSVFEEAMGQHLRDTPFGSATIKFNDIVPVVLALFCPLVTFGGLDKLKACFSGSRFQITSTGMTDEDTIRGREILDRERAFFKGSEHLGETHTAFTMRRVDKGAAKKAPPRQRSSETLDNPRAPMLTEDRGAPSSRSDAAPTRAEELKARLASKMETIKTGGEKKSSWTTQAGPSAPPPPAAATSGKSAGTVLDDLFANMR